MAPMTVVAGVDGSEESMRAAAWAATEARRHRAPMRLVAVAALPPRPRENDGGLPQAVAGELRDESVRALRDAITRTEELTPRLPVDTRLLTGPPALTVTASGAEALMLVLGARGAGGFDAMTIGSVSRYAAMHATCPVIVVRDDISAVRREVVVGISDPLDTSAALGFAFDEAAVRGATLVAVHSLDWLPAAAWRSAGSWRLAAEADSNLAEALAPWQEKYPGVPVRRDVLHDHPGHVLASYSGCADLVVIGRDESGVGGIQHAVLDHAHGPVAIVPRQLALVPPSRDVRSCPCGTSLPSVEGKDTGQWREKKMPGILVGIDGSAHAHHALEWAVNEAALRHAPLTVLTVSQPVTGWGVPMTYPADLELAEKAREAAEQETESALETLVAEARPPLVTVEAVIGLPAEALLKAAADADMIVVGSRGAGGFKRLLLGSVSTTVTHHAHCPIVVVPADRT